MYAWVMILWNEDIFTENDSLIMHVMGNFVMSFWSWYF